MSEDIFRNYYGKNYEKVKSAAPIEIRKMKANFIKKYPNATLSRFDFEVTFAKDGTGTSSIRWMTSQAMISHPTHSARVDQVPVLGRGVAKCSTGCNLPSK
jgi:hypothetical protein